LAYHLKHQVYLVIDSPKVFSFKTDGHEFIPKKLIRKP